MGYPLRCYLPGVTYEVTTRTIQERFLLRPSAVAREEILSIVARALVHCPQVRLHAFVFLSNHYHLLATCADGDEFAQFLAYVNGNIARRLGALHGWRGPFWARRAAVIPVLRDALVGRLLYLLKNSVKEGLVASPSAWPGATTTHALLDDMTIQTRWVDRDRLRRDRGDGTTRETSVYEHLHTIQLEPIPEWSHLGGDELRARHRELVAEAEQAARPTVVGIEKILAQDPHGSPDEPENSPAPTCHAANARDRALFRRVYDAFVAAFRTATTAIGQQTSRLTEPFPLGSFPRPSWFRRALPSADPWPSVSFPLSLH